MLRNYLKIALRNVRRHKGYALINIAGLSIGMACCILIIFYIANQLSYDRFHEHADRIHRLAIDAELGGRRLDMPISNNPSAPTIVKDYPEVVSAARILPRGRMSVSHRDHQFYEDAVMWADKSFFEVFTFPMIKGDPRTALEAPYTVVLTESLAEKMFGDRDPLGTIIQLDRLADYTVTGVVRDVPSNSHFTFHMLCSWETRFVNNPRNRDEWMNFNLYSYLLLAENASPDSLEEKFPALVEQNMGKILTSMGGRIRYFLQPLTDIHLHSNLEGEIQGNGSIVHVYIFAAVALFILLIACINFTNLATARSAGRAREVSLRKVVGAGKAELIKQFLGESLVYSFLAMLAALGLVRIGVPIIGSVAGIDLGMDIPHLPWLIPSLMGLVLFVGLTAGIYPAVFLSAFQPARVLKGSLKAGAADSRFRRALVVSQFIISTALIIGTCVIMNQIRFMRDKDLGFDKSHLLVTEIRGREMLQALDSIKARIKRIPGVEHVGASSIVPGGIPNGQIYIPEGFTEDEAQIMEQFNVDSDFIPALGMEMAAGRNFSKEFATDPAQAAIINQTAARVFGWEDPVGKIIQGVRGKLPGGGFDWEPLTVVGVVKDFHLSSLHKIIAPTLLTNTPRDLDQMSIKISDRNTTETLERMKAVWTGIDPNRPLDYFFLDDAFDSQYRAEERLGGIIGSFTIFAIFIACLGLFGMASFTAEQRTKEIGIRKVLGASVPGIISLLSREFLKLVFLANLVAWPLAYFGMRRWLQDFAYRTSIGPQTFVLTGLLALLIALFTVSYQSFRAALSDPIKAIKYE